MTSTTLDVIMTSVPVLQLDCFAGQIPLQMEIGMDNLVEV
jgi:hypothetical protein